MPSLNWIGKEAVANHDKGVPFKLLKKVKTASVGDSSQNLIIHGDNGTGYTKPAPEYSIPATDKATTKTSSSATSTQPKGGFWSWLSNLFQ